MHSCLRLAGFYLLCALNSNANCASFNINPVLVELSQTQKIETVTIQNREKEPLTLHLKIVRWQQTNGEDQYSDSNDLLVLPNVIKIGPEQSSIIRVVFKTEADAKYEKPYRHYIQEIPAHSSSPSSRKG